MQLIQESETLFGPLPEIMCMETGIGRTKGSRSDCFSMYFATVMPSCLCMFRRLTEAIIDKGIQLKRHDQSMRTTDCILNIISDGCLTIFGVIGGIDLTRTNENPMMHLADGCLTIFGGIGGIDLTRTNENPMMHLHRQKVTG